MRTIAWPGMCAAVSALCLGTVNYGTDLQEERAFAQLDRFFEAGGNWLDTAHVYGDWVPGPRGRSERVIGAWLKRTRAPAVIVTKGAHPRLDAMDVSRVTPADIRQDLFESLDNLGLAKADLYCLHRDDERVPVRELVDLLESLRAEGLIGLYGVSNWRLARIREALSYARTLPSGGFACNQALLSLADVRSAGIADSTMVPMDADMFAFHAAERLPVMAYMAAAKGYFSRRQQGGALPGPVEALYGHGVNDALYEQVQEAGRETGLPVAALSLRYLMQQPFECVPIASFDDDAQLAEGILSTEGTLLDAWVRRWMALKQYVVTDR